MTQGVKWGLIICFGVWFSTFALYWDTTSFEFTRFDDTEYVTRVPMTNGFSQATFCWATGSGTVKATANYHPLTMLSLLFDIGVAGGYHYHEDEHVAHIMHAHNAFLHACNAVLLFVFLLYLFQPVEQKTTGTKAAKCSGQKASSEWIVFSAAMIATLFWAWHPLRVESVAWISQRKDVLSLFYLLIGVIAYIRSLQAPFSGWGLLAVASYGLAFFSKPTAIVYPLLLIMIEYVKTKKITWHQNDLYLFLLVIFIGVTLWSQSVGGAMGLSVPVTIRLQNAIAGVGYYVMSSIRPTSLSALYLYKIPVPWVPYAIGLICLVCVFLVVLFRTLGKDWGIRKNISSTHILCVMGVFWFLISLGPVCGIVQVGYASHADRYTYLSGIGFSVIIFIWLIKLGEYGIIVKNQKKYIFGGVALLLGIMLGMTLITRKQMATWQTHQTLFEHMLVIDPHNYVAQGDLAANYVEKGKLMEGLKHGVEALKLVYFELASSGFAVATPETYDFAVKLAYSAVEGMPIERTVYGIPFKEDRITDATIHPTDPQATLKYMAQGLHAYSQGLYAYAMQCFQRVTQKEPDNADAWAFLGLAAEKQQDIHEALAAFRRSSELHPHRAWVTQKINRLHCVLSE